MAGKLQHGAGIAMVVAAGAACGARTELRGTNGSAPTVALVARHLALGMQHTCALVTAGVYCWGKGEGGELGDGTTNDSVTPVAATGLSGSNALSIASGAGFDLNDTRGSHTCAILADRSVACWGENIKGNYFAEFAHPTLVPTGIGITHAAAVAVSTFDGCAVIADGTIQCWGTDFDGALGDGSPDVTYPYSGKEPTPVKNLDEAVSVSFGAVGCAVRADGSVWCWGDGYGGELGNGKTGSDAVSALPVQADVAGAVSTTAYGGTCAILGDGRVTCWGWNAPTPTVVDGVSRAKQVAVGGTHACALVEGGGVLCWGDNTRGQLGIGTSGGPESAPQPVTQLPPVVEIAAGMGHTCALDADGGVWCWGENDMGQVGNPTLNDQPTPMRVSALP